MAINSFITLSSVVTLVIGALIGLLIGRRYSGNALKTKQVQQSLTSKTEELVNFRTEVKEHFNQTANHIRSLTENYYSLYEHLANSADKLCHDETITGQIKQVFVPNQLAQQPGKIRSDETIAETEVFASVNENQFHQSSIPQPDEDNIKNKEQV